MPRDGADTVAALQQDANILIPVNNTVTLKETTLIVTATRDETAIYEPFTTALVSTVAPLETTLSGTPTTLPASTTDVTTVLKAPPITVFSSAVKAASATCAPPVPTAGAAIDPLSDLTWGCKPGYVCSPKKPAGCNFFIGLPAPNYVCAAEDCVRAPPFVPAGWTENTTGQYPVVDPYFNLDPAEFGLRPSIFDFDLLVEDLDGEIFTFSTGNWGTRTSTDASLPTLGVRKPIPVGRKFGSWKRKPWTKALEKHLLPKRQIASTNPPICFGPCNDASIEAGAVGRTPSLCEPTSAYQGYLAACKTCISGNTADNSTKIDERITPSNAFAQFEDYCNAIQAVQGNLPDPNAQSANTGGESLGATEGIAGATDTEILPIGSSTTSRSATSTSRSTSATPTSSSNGTSTRPSSTSGPTSTRSSSSPTSTGPVQSIADSLRATGFVAVALPLFGAFLFL